MSIECRNLRFNLEKKTDRQARDILQAVPMGQRNQFILNAICSYGEQQTEEERQERFAQRVAEIVMDGLSDAPIFTVPGVAANTKEPDADVWEKSLAMAEDFLASWA